MKHTPVLLNECIEGLNIKPDGIYVDGTFGRGGHSLAILKKLQTGKLIAIDCDEEAIAFAKSLHHSHSGKLRVVRGNFRNIDKLLRDESVQKVDGMIFDLGFSSPQIDKAERGLSYNHSARLDMRLDNTLLKDAHYIINNETAEVLSNIFFRYGEEKYSKQIAAKIIKARAISQIETTKDLSDVILSAIPSSARRAAGHPAKRCFQALRIAVNDELGSLSEMLSAAPEFLANQARICIITFHSLEDRIVKQSFIEKSKSCTCPANLPVCICNTKPQLKIITKKPITASKAEIESNPRARSAKLRIAEKQ